MSAQKAAEFLKRKEAQRQAKITELYDLACRDFQTIITMIIKRYRPRRIYQWGSLLRKEYFSEISDIDIAVEGLGDSTVIFDLLKDAETLTNFPLDIVELERIEPVHEESIRRKGKLIYEREK